MESNKSSNKVIIALLAVLTVMVAGLGGYFIIRDINRNQDNNKSSTSQTTDDKDKSSDNQPSSSSDPGSASGDIPSSTPTPEPVQPEIAAGITYAEVRSNNYFIEAQVNEQVSGTCDISIVPTDGGQGHHETEELEISNGVSICNEYFSLKGMNPGEHKVTVVINAADGRTKTLERIVNI